MTKLATSSIRVNIHIALSFPERKSKIVGAEFDMKGGAMVACRMCNVHYMYAVKGGDSPLGRYCGINAVDSAFPLPLFLSFDNLAYTK